MSEKTVNNYNKELESARKKRKDILGMGQFTLGLDFIDETSLETKINSLYVSLESDNNKYKEFFFQRACLIGQLLTEKKTELVHGNFTEWIEKNLQFGNRQAQRYITLFENKNMFTIENDESDTRVAFESFRQAISVISKQKKDTVSENKSKQEKKDSLKIYEEGLSKTAKNKENTLRKLLNEMETVQEEITNLSKQLKEKTNRLDQLKKIHSRYWKEK